MKRVHDLSRQGGFTIIEVLVAMFVLLIGVLATTTLLNTANATTDRNQSRNSAINLDRDIIEASRALPYSQTKPTVNSSGVADATFQNALQAVRMTGPGVGPFADAQSTVPGWQITRRGVTFTVRLAACVVDDAKDKVAASHTPAAADGTGFFCPGLPTSPGTDNDPDDYRRVKVTTSWTRDTKTFSVTQTGVIINPTGGLGPAPVGDIGVSGQTCPAAASFTATFKDTATSAVFTIDPLGTQTTVSTPSSTDAANGTKTYTYNWNPSSGSVPDNTYTVFAQAFNDNSEPGRQAVKTFVVNCSEPAGPTGLTGGFDWRRCTAYPATCNAGERMVDLEWNENSEFDVVGYQVYRVNGVEDWSSSRPAADPADTLVSCPGKGGATTHPGPADFFESHVPACMDGGVAAQPIISGSISGLTLLQGATASYYVRAVDPDPADPTGATLRTVLTNHSDVFTVNENMLNVRPTPPILTITNVKGSPCLSWTNSLDLDALGTDLGQSAIRFYRIYRDGSPVAILDLGNGVHVNDVPYADRIGRTNRNVSGSCDTANPTQSWFLDTSAGGSSWNYWVTAVDQNWLESYPSNQGTWTAT